MEMEPNHSNNDESSIEESSSEQSSPPCSPKRNGIYGDPDMDPRVGDEYQAEIPPMVSEYEHAQLLKNPLEFDVIVDISHHFLMGLPIPMAWIHNKINNRDDEGCRMDKTDDPVHTSQLSKSKNSRKGTILKSKCSRQNAEPVDLEVNDQIESKPENPGSTLVMKANSSQLQKSRHYHPVPGSFSLPWTDSEVHSFILGLYIFGKNFIQIERFIENKKMGEILSFYYGEFYRSDGYRRWSDRKKRRKKCICGEKIFKGWRHHELLSRLQSHVPKDSHNAFLEVSTAFSEEKISLEDYVSNLKSIVGIQVLVDSIRIGKGKEDLTSVSMEPGKNNPLFTICPIGKACSSLTSADIIKLLNGGVRLSKARCNDIFWEAVWPRLLARGWHSEQPNNQGYLGPNHYLVFLIPGVKKFSRRKLVKGDHYFDSINDVLNKVASEPTLIELESEDANEDVKCIAEVTSGEDDPSIRKIDRYLKPRVSSCYNMNTVRFTVIDSGLADGGKISKIREMRYLPDDLKVKSLFTTLSSNIKMIFSDKSTSNKKRDAVQKPLDSDFTKFTIVDTSLIHPGGSSKVRELRYAPVDLATSEAIVKNEQDSSEDFPDRHLPNAASGMSSGDKNVNKSNQSKDGIDGGESEQKMLIQDDKNKSVETLEGNNNVSNSNQSARTITHKFSRRSRSGLSNNLVPVVKRRRLTACSKNELSHVMENMGSKPEGSCYALSLSSLQANQPEKSSITTSVTEEAIEESTRDTLDSPRDGTKTSTEEENAKCKTETETPSLLDLNLLQVPLESENNEPQKTLNASVDASSAVVEQQQANLNPRRQSTRNRPLTTRALEALECGYFGAKRQKNMEVHVSEFAFSASSHRVDSKAKVMKPKEEHPSEAFDKKDIANQTRD